MKKSDLTSTTLGGSSRTIVLTTLRLTPGIVSRFLVVAGLFLLVGAPPPDSSSVSPDGSDDDDDDEVAAEVLSSAAEASATTGGGTGTASYIFYDILLTKN